jgi:O-antigen/teichoic acid export membrane protein
LSTSAAAAVPDAARRSLLFSLMGRYGAAPLRLASTVVLARLLAPEEFGAYAAALAAVQLAGVLAEIGATQYLVQAREVTEAERRSVFGLALTLGVLAAAVLAGIGLLAPPALVAPEVGTVLAIAALGLVVQPAVAVLSADLQRALRFGPIALSGVAGAATLAGVSVALATLGAGAASIAIAGVVELLVVAAMLSRHARLPRPGFRGWRPVFGFGWAWSAIGGLRQAGDALSRLAVGTLMGLGPLGVLSRAQVVVQVFDKALMDAVTPVVLPALSAAQRAGRPLGPAYLRQVACLAAVAWPFFAALALLAEPAVRLLLGPAWGEAVPVVRWLCLAGLFLPLSALVLPYLVAVGELRAWLPVQAGLQIGRLALVVPAALVSLELVAAVLALEAAAKGAAAQRLLSRHLDVAARELGWVLARSIPAAGAVLLAVLGVMAVPALRDGSAAVLLGSAALLAGPTWLLAVVLLRHPLAGEITRLRAMLAARLASRAARATPQGTPP